VNGVPVNLLLHQLVHFAHGGDYYDKGTSDISHICENKKCGTPTHLCVEVKKVNLSRLKCRTVALDCADCRTRYLYALCAHPALPCRKLIPAKTVDRKLIVNVASGGHEFLCVQGHTLRTTVPLQDAILLHSLTA
jgi:hypothetical protein